MPPRLRSLYVCYLSLDDPLVETQVVAYLEGLAGRGHEVHLLTFEPRRVGRRERRRVRQRLHRRGLHWHRLRYHARPSLPATVYDVACAVALGAALIRRHRLDAVHARSHVPAAAALLLRRLTGCRVIFDMRGLLAEEYVDAGRWSPGSLPFRITKWVERRAIDRAEAVIVLTERVRRHLFTDRPREGVWVIPCCTDVARLEAQSRSRATMREQLGLRDATVMAYVGKLTGLYMQREMADLFASAREVIPDLHFLVLTQSDPAPIVAELERVGAGSGDCTITTCAPDAVGEHLAAADLAISLIAPSFSKIAASPTKIGEYLAAGLPTVCSAGVGDVDDLLEAERVGVLVRRFAPDAYRRAAQDVQRLRSDPLLGQRCRAVAGERLSLETVGMPRYAAVYDSVAGPGRAR